MADSASSNHFCKLMFRLAVLALFSLAFTAVGRSQNVSEDPRIFGGPERQLYNGVPPKLPLKFNIKNVTSDRWVHELEIEVTNTSDKPIYFMHMYLFMVGVKYLGKPWGGLWLYYGRPKLLDFSEPLLPEDVPLKPGEAHTLRISEGDAKAWDTLRLLENRPEPKFLKLLFQGINFGDGTGYLTTAGEPVGFSAK